MISSRLLTGALALLAASVVNAGVCYPSSIRTLSTTVATSSSSIETTSTSESAITTETGASSDTTSAEASTTDLVITTTAEATSDTTTSAATTTTSAPVDNPPAGSCIDANDCLLSTDPLCVLGLCECVNDVCVPQDIESCSVDAECSQGQICENGVCTTPPPECASAQDCRNLGRCVIFPVLCPCVSGQCAG
ncbi:HET domain-containing protein [Fusarium keratoplasticum]|nr:HET domain-containing protein [Fusarium keratoplasticum]